MKNKDLTELKNELYKSYSSPEARKVVEYMWDMIDSIYWTNKRIIETIKNVADDSEYLVKKLSTIQSTTPPHLPEYAPTKEERG